MFGLSQGSVHCSRVLRHELAGAEGQMLWGCPMDPHLQDAQLFTVKETLKLLNLPKVRGGRSHLQGTRRPTAQNPD